VVTPTALAILPRRSFASPVAKIALIVASEDFCRRKVFTYIVLFVIPTSVSVSVLENTAVSVRYRYYRPRPSKNSL